MKAKDVRTLESVLLEYGMSSGASTPTSQQQTGATAKANKKTSPTTQKTTPKKDLGSPTTQPGLKAEPEQPEIPQPVAKKAGELDVDAEFKDDKGEVAGKVVSKLGDTPQPDKVVVQDPKGEYKIVDPKDDVFVDLEENQKVKKLSQKSANKVKSHIKDSKKKIKRLAKLGLQEAPEKLFEINFRKKEVINSSLDAQIRCGWEAESIWEDLEEQSDDVDNMTLDEVDNEFGGVDWDSIAENFTDWIYEYKVDEYMDDAIDDFINEREDDEDYINEFIEDEGIEESDWDDYREGVLRTEYGDERFEEEGAEELSELYGYEDENWAREYVDEYRSGDFRDYLRSIAEEDDDIKQAAYETASEQYSYDDWISEQWYSMSSFCDDYGIDYSSSGSISEVADRLESWISDHSAFHNHRPEHGDYGNTSGDTTEYAVETDSSIDGYGTGAEIISPVFSTPRRMLAELEKFFAWFKSEGVVTNNSTGLHITMSYNPQDGETVNHKAGSSKVIANKVKMAVLLGDQYLLSEWGRSGNTYTKSQLADLKKAIQNLKVEGKGTDAIKNAEKFLEDNISSDKFRSIHFKGQTDSKTNTNLIEFRIGGGEDYHTEFKRVFSSVVRYATSMIAGHTDQYEGDYAKALSRLLNKMNDVSSRDEEEVENLKSSSEDFAGHPILDTHKAIASSKNYLEFVQIMLNAMKDLNSSTKFLEPDADKEWKAKWTEYLDNTSDNLEDFDSSLKRSLNKITENINEAPNKPEPIKAYLRPEMTPPSERASELRAKGIRQFSEAMGMLALDISNGKARTQPSAKSVGALRKFLKLHEISDTEIDANLKVAMDDLNFGRDLPPKSKIEIIRKGIDSLFKKDIIVRPDYITAPQVEALIKGLWNVVNADKFNSVEADKVKKLCVRLRMGDNTANIEQKEIEIDIDRMINAAINKREFNDFYNHLTRSGYNNTTYLVSPGHIYDKNAYNELIRFVKQSEPYTQPVSKSHNPNLYNDDSYVENALSKYTLLLRRRFAFLEDQHDNDVSLARQSLERMVPLIETFFKENEVNRDEGGNMSFETLVGIDELDIRNPEPDHPRVKKMSDEEKEQYLELYNDDDGEQYLGIRSYRMERIQDTFDDIARGETERRTVSAMSEFITDSIRESLSSYYKNKDRYPKYYVIPEVKNLIKQRFESLATFMRSIDKIFVDNGFESQDTSIKRKQQIDTDAEKFKKKMADKPLATVNIPSHSWTYINPRLWNEIEALAEAEEKIQPESTLLKQVIQSAQAVGQYNTGILQDGGGIAVIPAAHWSQAQDALNGKDLIKIQQKFGNNSQTWRLNNYNKIIDEFRQIYKTHPKNIIGNDETDGWHQLDGRDRDLISKIFRVEFTGKLDGRVGMGDVDELMPSAVAKNQVSGEPLERNSAVSWSLSDGNAKKQFAAYDFEKWHDKDADTIKKQTAERMKKGMPFYKAVAEAIDTIDPNIKLHKDLVQAAGVEDYIEDSSNTIAQKTNWTNLAMFLKIEPGVNNQGIGLLKKTYQMYDGNSSGAFAAEGHSIERWVDAVKKAKKYIETNYTEGGGNYFRKDDPEGQPSGASGRYDYNADEPTTRSRTSNNFDYDGMREKYIQFNNMMRDGIGFYILRPEVNDLVAFLENPANDEEFKKAVMNKLILDKIDNNSELPRTFQDALTKGRQYLAQNQEGNDFDRDYEATLQDSVFAKFDALPLQEQLAILSESKVLERPLSKGEKKDKEKYVKGMKKSKGDFEKRYGKDAKAVMYATATKMAKEDLDETTNEFDRIKILNDILSDHFPVSDLKKQMLAFQAIPMPEMLNAFRELRAQGGDDACARGIVRHFVNALPEYMQDKVNLHEWSKQHLKKIISEYTDLSAEKDNIIKTISGLDATNDQHAELLDRIFKLLNSEHIGKTLDKAFSYPLMDEPFSDKQKQKVISDVTKIISALDSDYGTMSKFIEQLEKTGTVVNISELDKPLNTFANVFGDDISTKAFRALTSYGVGVNQKGPGEYGLACLSNKIRLASGEGDLEIEGIGKVELKAATSSTGGRIGYGGGSQKAKQAIIDKYAEYIPITAGSVSGSGYLGFTKFINGLNEDLPVTDINNQKLRKQISEDLFSMDMDAFAGPLCDVISTNANAEEIENAYLKQNFLWYKDRDDFDALLLISIPNMKTAMIKNENDLIAFRRSGHAMSTSISIVPTQAGAGREQWAQLSLKAGTI